VRRAGSSACQSPAGESRGESTCQVGGADPLFGCNLIALSRSPVWIAIQVLVISPAFVALVSAVFYAAGRLLGGRGAFSAVFSTHAFASVPTIIQAPLAAWLHLSGLGGATGLVGFVFGLWALVLQMSACAPPRTYPLAAPSPPSCCRSGSCLCWRSSWASLTAS
jgi:hypothetical protein